MLIRGPPFGVPPSGTMSATIFIGVALAAVTAFVYILVGNRVGARELSGDDRLANSMFAAWWWSLGLITAFGALINLAAGIGYTNLIAHLVLTVVLLFVLCASLWALGFYLVYLFTGRRGAIYPLGVFYLAYYGVIMYLIFQGNPTGVIVERWGARIEYEQPLLAGGQSTLFLLLLVAPQVIGGIAYFSLFFRVDDRSQKYRIAMIAGSIVVWFGSSVVASAAGLTGTDVWAVTSRLIALCAAAVVFFAFQPPGWVQRRLRVQPVAVLVDPVVRRGGDRFTSRTGRMALTPAARRDAAPA